MLRAEGEGRWAARGFGELASGVVGASGLKGVHDMVQVFGVLSFVFTV